MISPHDNHYILFALLGSQVICVITRVFIMRKQIHVRQRTMTFSSSVASLVKTTCMHAGMALLISLTSVLV